MPISSRNNKCPVTIHAELIDQENDSNIFTLRLKNGSFICVDRENFTIDSIEDALNRLRANAMSDDEIEELLK